MEQQPHISIVTPVYGCKTCLTELYLRLKKVLAKMGKTYEIIMINDASPDNAWEIIAELAEKDEHIIGVNFSRNFGQHYAITAGLDFARGKWVVVMDCDLQDQPEEIPKLYAKAMEGFEVVFGRRESRTDGFFKRQGSKYFHKMLAYLTDTEQDSAIANFGIYHEKVVNAIASMKDSMRYFPAMVRWVGFSATALNIEHAERSSGQTSYSFRKLVSLALNVILAFSDKPLRLIINFGLSISTLSIVFAIFQIVQYFNGKIEVLGWTSMIISIWFLSGIMFFMLGIVGLYVGKTFDRVKHRPIYIVKELKNTSDNV